MFLIEVEFLPQQHLLHVQNVWEHSGLGAINFLYT